MNEFFNITLFEHYVDFFLRKLDKFLSKNNFTPEIIDARNRLCERVLVVGKERMSAFLACPPCGADWR